MKPSSFLVVYSILCQLILRVPIASAEAIKDTLKRLEDALGQKYQNVMEWTNKLEKLRLRNSFLRKQINDMNDETRVTSFELNNVPFFCTDDEDKFIILDMFACAIGMEYNESDIIGIKHFFKKTGRDLMAKTSYLNYIVNMKTLAQKEAWMDQFLTHVRSQGYKEVFDFPGVCKLYPGELTSNRYSLRNVTLRDHISPFKVSLMSVVRGKVKNRRHYFRIRCNRTQLIVDRIMPKRATVRHIIEDFSDIHQLHV